MYFIKELTGMRLYLPEPFTVTKESAEAFAKSIFDDSFSVAKTPTFLAPPTFVSILQIKMLHALFEHQDVNFTLKNIVHAGQSIEIIKDIKVGSSLGAELSITSARELASGGMIVCSIRVFDWEKSSDSDTLVRCGITLLVHSGGQISAPKKPEKNNKKIEALLEEKEIIVGKTYTQQEVKKQNPEVDFFRILKILRRDICSYSVASFDDNPIHTDDLEAQNMGFECTIAHGMFVMGCAVSSIQQVFDSFMCVRFASLKFSNPLYIDETGAYICVVGKVIKGEKGNRELSIDVRQIVGVKEEQKEKEKTHNHNNCSPIAILDCLHLEKPLIVNFRVLVG